MTGRLAVTVASCAAALLVGACTSFYEVPIETPIQPKLDVTGFQRVLIAGFIAGGSEDVDANLETVRLLRSQLRLKSGLKVIEADAFPLIEMAREPERSGDGNGFTEQPEPTRQTPRRIRDERDLETYEHIFADVDFWRKIGEEYQNPLIVTGTILFQPHAKSSFVQGEREVYDSFGRRRVIPTRTYIERKGFILKPKFIFIDGRSGTTLYSETFREEILYSAQQNTPALSSYFELMDRLIPSFLSTLSTQKVRGTRVLLK